MMKSCLSALVILSGVLCLAAGAWGADWPQWQGLHRDATSPETGLLKTWPAGGPKLLWTAGADLGAGFSSASVAGGTVYVTGVVGKDGVLFALDTNGKLKWKVTYGPEWTKSHAGARTTPTVVGDKAYVFSGLGRLTCIDLPAGKEAWSVDTLARFNGKNITWGIAESPLVYGSTVICTPGGPDASVVALDRNTGKTLWTSRGLSDRSGYCSPILIADGKRNLIVTVTAGHIVGVAADDGQVLWKVPYSNKCAAHPNTPIYRDGQIYVTSGYDEGGVALRLAADGKSVQPLWKDTTLDTHHGGDVLVGGYLYGASWLGNSNGNWVCLDWKSGKVKYDTHRNGKGSILAAEGMLYCYDEGGNVSLVKATPEGFHVVSSFRVAAGDGAHWAHPAISDGRLYIRHGRALMAYDIRSGDFKPSAAPADGKTQTVVRRVVDRADDSQAQAMFAVAKSYLKMGMTDKAKADFEAIVQKYPGTQAAADAAQELENLK